MKIAGKPARLSRFRKTYAITPMRARIDKNVDFIITPSHHYDGILTDMCGQEVTRLRQLRVVRDKHPAPGKNPFKL
ncbi:hypothetical protein GCM10027428_00170 [Haliea atlantica]